MNKVSKFSRVPSRIANDKSNAPIVKRGDVAKVDTKKIEERRALLDAQRRDTFEVGSSQTFIQRKSGSPIKISSKQGQALNALNQHQNAIKNAHSGIAKEGLSRESAQTLAKDTSLPNAARSVLKKLAATRLFMSLDKALSSSGEHKDQFLNWNEIGELSNQNGFSPLSIRFQS